ncbi:lysylphosphatidylglycerol synthase domain-containing protein [Mesorhizobium sp. M1295]|uniref:lysylphosphatidylglycerol synthase domain-containing protein n=1 Tax=unclassified Mesorhizobium TaxID=325217 RepID=UPI00333CAA22
MNWRRYFWPVIGIAAVVFSLWLLLHELRGISLDDVWAGIIAIPARGWVLAALSSVIAYASLAGYDHIALLHIGKKVSWLFVTFCSFTTYALSHNIGGSVFSGAVIRYRAYGTRGLTGQDVGILVAICWITFVLSTLFVSSIVLLLEPEVIDRFSGIPHHRLAQAGGFAMLLVVAAYVFGSWLHLRPLRIGSFQLHYPALPIVARQLLVGPIELLAAAAIIFFALPATGNPGYFIVLGVFLVSFSIAQISHAPGGLGVFEVVFLAGLSHMDQVGVLAALLVFRLFYLIIPLLIALGVVLFFEHSQYSRSES